MTIGFHEQLTLFDGSLPKTHARYLLRPDGYKGLAGFHKYWGKKPLECLIYLVETLSCETDLILDPFLGSGLIARESVIRNRRFIGIDINPIAIDLATMFVNLPSVAMLRDAIKLMEDQVRPTIDESYQMATGDVATHYLWRGSNLESVWTIRERKNGRKEFLPTEHDRQLASSYDSYKPRHARPIKFFQNSRINTTSGMTILDIFTGRALHNIDILMEFIQSQPEAIRRALKLVLTAASGQMSKMVFAIENRGKSNGKTSRRIEVGSWVIGYWLPELHFEVNAWNCFVNKIRRLEKSITSCPLPHRLGGLAGAPREVVNGKFNIGLFCGDARARMSQIASESISLILTDPPHSDRIPYLELSEMWNGLLRHDVDFTQEIVVSNARDREKGKEQYSQDMTILFQEAVRLLRNGGYIAILFNARDAESWKYLEPIESLSDILVYRGCFPMNYSAGSVVQDNRIGSLKSDFVLIYQKVVGKGECKDRLYPISRLPGWTTTLPIPHRS